MNISSWLKPSPARFLSWKDARMARSTDLNQCFVYPSTLFMLFTQSQICDDPLEYLQSLSPNAGGKLQ